VVPIFFKVGGPVPSHAAVASMASGIAARVQYVQQRSLWGPQTPKVTKEMTNGKKPAAGEQDPSAGNSHVAIPSEEVSI